MTKGPPFRSHGIRRGALALLVSQGLTLITLATGSDTTSILSASEQNIINIFKRVSPAVVSVANKAVLQDLDDYQLYEIPRGTGSGFVWDKDGHIISNVHVIYGASAIQVTLNNGSSYPASIVGLDPDHDIAVLKIQAPPNTLIPIVPGTSSNLQVGQTALAIGNPFGLDTSLGVGVVSALGRRITSLTQRQIRNVIQTDAAINPGNSGGPLLDSEGLLIGMNTAIISPSGAYAGVGFAIPVDTIRRTVPQLIKTGRTESPSLGIRLIPNTLLRRTGEKGVVILSVEANSPADKAGLKGLKRGEHGTAILGDILTEINDIVVTLPEDVDSLIESFAKGDKIRIGIQRGNNRKTVILTL